jgi:putative addiction module component (TIGR02574 family)
MAMTVEELTAAALALSEEDRAFLADRLTESLETPEETEHRKAWEIEIRRRVEELESGKVKGIPLDEVMERVRRAVGRSS